MCAYQVYESNDNVNDRIIHENRVVIKYMIIHNLFRDIPLLLHGNGATFISIRILSLLLQCFYLNVSKSAK